MCFCLAYFPLYITIDKILTFLFFTGSDTKFRYFKYLEVQVMLFNHHQNKRL